MGIVNAKFDVELESVEINAMKFIKKGTIQAEIYAHSNKSQKLLFSHILFTTLSMDSKSARKGSKKLENFSKNVSQN